MGGEEIQEIPLGHESDELAARGEMGEVSEGDDAVAKMGFDLSDFLVRLAEKLGEQTELVHELEGRRMDGVAAEIAEEIAMFFEHEHVESGAREEETEHHSGGAGADDATAGAIGFDVHGW